MNPPARTAERVAIAACAIACGVATYVWLRPSPAMFLPTGWHRPLAQGVPVEILGALPTFVHALALSLLTAAVLNARRVALLRAVCASWCAIELAFELAQHPIVAATLLARWPCDIDTCVALKPIAHFMRGGSFNRLDLAAAVLGSAAAYALMARRDRRVVDS